MNLKKYVAITITIATKLIKRNNTSTRRCSGCETSSKYPIFAAICSPKVQIIPNAKIPKIPELEVTGKIAELDWSTWKKYLEEAKDTRKEGVHFTDLVKLKVGKLYIFGETFENVSLKIKPTKKGQEVYFLTKNIDGKIYIPNNPKEHITGNFKKLHIRTTDKENIVKFEPHELSPFSLKINDLRYNDIALKNFSRDF